MPKHSFIYKCSVCGSSWEASTADSILKCPKCAKTTANPRYIDPTRNLSKDELIKEALREYREKIQKGPHLNNSHHLLSYHSIIFLIKDVKDLSFEKRTAIEDAIRRAAVLEDNLRIKDISCSEDGYITLHYNASAANRKPRKPAQVLLTLFKITLILFLTFSLFVFVNSCIHAFGV